MKRDDNVIDFFGTADEAGRGGFDPTPEGDALLAAAARGDAAEIRALLAAGAPIGARDDRGNGVLHLLPQGSEGDEAARVVVKAARDGRIEGMATMASPDVHGGGTPLHAAAAAGNAERIATLYKLFGAERALTVVDRAGRTPLHHAARDGEGECVELLLRVRRLAESDILEARDREGRTPLFVAAERGNLDAATLLLAAGANPNAADRRGNTPLHGLFSAECPTPAKRGEACATAERLIEAGASPALLNVERETVLHAAARGGSSVLIAKAALLPGMSLEARNGAGETALHVAAAAGNHWAISGLARHAPNYEARDREGLTPLQRAAREGHSDAAATLVVQGADPHADGPHGNAFDEAVLSGNVAAGEAMVRANKGTYAWSGGVERSRLEMRAAARENDQWLARQERRRDRGWELGDAVTAVSR